MKQQSFFNQINKLLIKLFVFLIPVSVIFIVFFGFIFPKMILNSKDANILKWNEFYNKTINSDILILGSSTAFRGINPTILASKLNKKCYNYANIGMPLINYPRLLHDYLLKNKPPEILIVSVDIFGLENSDNFGGIFWLLPSLHNQSRMYQELERLKYIKHFKPYAYFIYRHIYFKLIEKPNTRSSELNGFEPQNITWRVGKKPLENSLILRIDTMHTVKAFSELN